LVVALQIAVYFHHVVELECTIDDRLEGAAMLSETVVAMDHIEHHCLDEGSKILQDEAIRVIGTYDYGWPQLAAATQRQRETRGFAANEPLLLTGDLRDSIERVVQPGVAYVGSNNEKALWHELGTSRIPPRSFLAGAAAAKDRGVGRQEIPRLAGQRVMMVQSSQSPPMATIESGMAISTLMMVIITRQ
jgi:hypothetical protein